MMEALIKAGLSFEQISYVIATGYGRFNVPFADRQITELSCHAKGVSNLFPLTRTAIDIGGQDAKGLKIKDGNLVDFVMNDKCAAGTGRFLEVIAAALGIKVGDLGDLSLKSTNKVMISNTCTIFARQEVVARLSEGVRLENIVAGLHNAIASRVAGMVRRLKIEPGITLTGGVAKNIGVVKAMEENLGQKVFVPDEPLLTGAIGAAILGKEFLAKGETFQRKGRRLEEVTFYS
jgi:predicted CoA-substrate-specific enzyme activase